MQYYVQTQAPNGNWTDCLGTNDLDLARRFMQFQERQGKIARVVKREDTVVL